MSGSGIGFLIFCYLCGWVAVGVGYQSASLGLLWPIWLPLRGLKEIWERMRE